MLVGHTDASGGFEANLRLSRLRAESVRQALLSIQGVVPDQVQAEGIGPLAPRVTNLTEEGRRQNRWVEVMVTSTELLERLERRPCGAGLGRHHRSGPLSM